MKTFIKTTMVTFLIIIGVLVVWAYVLHLNVLQTAQAASNPPTLAQCAQPELAGIKELLSKATSQEDISLLTEKKKALEQAEQDCITKAESRSPAQKPRDRIGVLLPEPTPNPGYPKMGIQRQELLPVGNFIPVSDMPNFWAGMYKGNLIEIAAGFLREENESQVSQGALYVVINGEGTKGVVYPTPSRNGSIHLVSICANIINVEATDGTLFSFNIETFSYLENAIFCSIP